MNFLELLESKGFNEKVLWDHVLAGGYSLFQWRPLISVRECGSLSIRIENDYFTFEVIDSGNLGNQKTLFLAAIHEGRKSTLCFKGPERMLGLAFLYAIADNVDHFVTTPLDTSIDAERMFAWKKELTKRMDEYEKIYGK